MTSLELSNLRRDYAREALSESSVSTDPFEQFHAWMSDALDAQLIDANAMVLATVGTDGRPSARVVLLKDFGPTGFTFYTNYNSKKGRDLADKPDAALHFFWAELERQVSISGSVEKTTKQESEEYFRTRPLESRLGALASNQSETIASREVLEERLRELRIKYSEGEVPLPDYWGGFRLKPVRFEFWQGRPNRLHDRICYELESEGQWKISRLSP